MIDIEDTYLTISKTSEGLYKEKGSKFIALCYPVESEEEVKNTLEAIKKEYYDARHHCYAYILGEKSENYRANDDGEPNHSAGDPILGQIRSRNLTNTLVVVVRYFGGTKLGVSGLISAYKAAAADALDQNEIIEKWITKKINFTFEYPDMNEVMRIVKELEATILHQDFQISCEMVLDFRLSSWQEAHDRLKLLKSVKIRD